MLATALDSLGLLVSLGDGGSVDMADISGDTGRTPDIVQAQSGDERVGLEQQAQGLSDPTAGTEDGDFALGSGGRGEGSGGGLECGSGEHCECVGCELLREKREAEVWRGYSIEMS